MFMRRAKIRPNVGRKTQATTPTESVSSATTPQVKVPETPTLKEPEVATDHTVSTEIAQIPDTVETTIAQEISHLKPSEEVSTVPNEKDTIPKEPIPETCTDVSVKETPSIQQKSDVVPPKPSAAKTAEHGLSSCETIELPVSIFGSVSPVKQASKRPKVEKELPRSRRWHNKIKEPPERSKMTMMDLIYWNPSENPMTPSVKASAPQQKQDNAEKENQSSKPDAEQQSAMPAPRVKVDENGAIILDEESLVIEHTPPENYTVVTEDAETNYFSFRERLVSKRWSTQETGLFYKALTIIGTDFSLMAQLLRNRSRHELKLKFKREEKKHRKAIDRMLTYSNVQGLDEFREELDVFYENPPPDDTLKKNATTESNHKKKGRRKRKVQDSDSENCEPNDSLPTRNKSPAPTDISDNGTIEGDDPKGAAEEAPEETNQPLSKDVVKRPRGRPRKKPPAAITDSDEPSPNIPTKKSRKRRSKKIEDEVMEEECDELQQIKEAVDNFIEDTKIAPVLVIERDLSVLDQADIAAYVTVEKVGKQWLQVSETMKKYKAKYSDFTVTDLDTPKESNSMQEEIVTECFPVEVTFTPELSNADSSSSYIQLQPLIPDTVLQQS